MLMSQIPVLFFINQRQLPLQGAVNKEQSASWEAPRAGSCRPDLLFADLLFASLGAASRPQARPTCSCCLSQAGTQTSWPRPRLPGLGCSRPGYPTPSPRMGGAPLSCSHPKAGSPRPCAGGAQLSACYLPPLLDEKTSSEDRGRPTLHVHPSGGLGQVT